MEVLSFGSDDIDNALANFTPEDLDSLAFGAILLDSNATILAYNATESAITGCPVEEVLGKNFFVDVAPCTSTAEFKGRFDEGIAHGHLDVIFEYAFVFEHHSFKVKVHMKNAIEPGRWWIFVKRI